MPRVYPTAHAGRDVAFQYREDGYEVDQSTWNRIATQSPLYPPFWTVTPPSEPSPQPPSPPNDPYSELTASPPPSPPVRMRNLNSVWQVMSEVDYEQIRRDLNLARTSSGHSATVRAGAGDSPVTPQTFKKEGNTFKEFIQKTMNTES